MPDLYMGEPIVVLARMDADAERVDISGRFGAALWTTAVRLSDGRDHPGIAALWGRAAIRKLMDDHRWAEDRDAVRARIVEVALRHKLVSRFTSLVAIDKPVARPAAAEITSGAVPTNMPEGWSRDAVFGREPAVKAVPIRAFRPDMPLLGKARATMHGRNALSVPQTATSARLMLMLGLTLLALALGLGLFWGRARSTAAMNRDLLMRERGPAGPA